MLNLLENKLIKIIFKKVRKSKVKLKSSFNFDDKYKIERFNYFWKYKRHNF